MEMISATFNHHCVGNTFFTWRWNVPSSAATIIVFPLLANSSQNSTISGNYGDKDILNEGNIGLNETNSLKLTNCPSSIPIIL